MPKPPRRRPPTIDLEATEVASGGPAATPTDSAPDPAGSGPQATTPENERPASPEPVDSPAADALSEAAAPAGEVEPEGRARNGGIRPVVIVAAGIAGASIAAVAAAIVWGAGLLPPSIRLANSEATAPLVQRIDAIEHQVGEIAARPAPPSQAQLGELETRLSKVEAAPEAASKQQLQDVEGRLGKLETAAAAPPAPPSGLKDIEARLAKVEAAATAPPATDPGIADRIAALDQRVTEALTTAQAAASRAEAAQKAAAPQADALESAASMHANLDALSARVNGLEQGVKQIDRRVSELASVAASDRAVRLGLAAMELRMAVERGVPYAAELAAVKQLAPDQGILPTLEPFADGGVPSPGTLAQELAKLEPDMLNAAGAPGQATGMLSRLEESASRLVRIRPIEAAPGTDARAIVTRAEASAARGDVVGALSELERLPENVRALAAGWIGTAHARIAALDAARQLSASALGALSKPAH